MELQGFEDMVLANVLKLFADKMLEKKAGVNALALLIRSIFWSEGVVQTVLRGLRR